MKLSAHQHEGVAAFLAQVDHVGYMPKELEKFAACRTILYKGKLSLEVRRDWEEIPVEGQIETLAHEAGHIILRHIPRREERDWAKWGLVTDAALHHNKLCCDWEIIDAALGIQTVTFERLGIPPSRPEIAYEMLKGGEGMQACGSLQISEIDDDVESFIKLEQVVSQVGSFFASAKAGTSSGPGAAIGTIPPPPPWIRNVVDRLVYAKQRLDRGRSWRKFNRHDVELMPGRSKRFGVTAQIFVDQSGSCWGDLPQFFAAVCATPELAGTRIYGFDDGVRGPVVASDTVGVRALLESSSGGTLIAKAGEWREKGSPVVWLTDAESADGLPPKHDVTEIWCVRGNAPTPGRERIRVE